MLIYADRISLSIAKLFFYWQSWYFISLPVLVEMGAYAHIDLTTISQPVGSEELGILEFGDLGERLGVFMCPCSWRCRKFAQLRKRNKLVASITTFMYSKDRKCFLSSPRIGVRSARKCHLALVLVECCQSRNNGRERSGRLAVPYKRTEDETERGQKHGIGWGRGASKGFGKGGSNAESRFPPPPTTGPGIRNA